VVQVLPERPVSPDEDVVVLTVPADGAYLSVLRTATAGLAARLHYTLDEIEDLRIAVDEACAMLLAGATDETELTCTFEVADDELAVSVSVPANGSPLPGNQTFAWMVLSALAGEVTADVGDGRSTIRLTKHRDGGS
jgi:serine/threonine-protein kinase RsbW